MLLKEAYEKSKKSNVDGYLVGAIDTGDKWGFMFSDEPRNSEDIYTGGSYTMIDKKTGTESILPVNITTFEILSDSKKLELSRIL